MIEHKKNRIDLIIKILSDAQQELSITDIEKELKKLDSSSPSRKTIERYVLEMINRNILYECSSRPLRVSMTGRYGTVMHLSHEEITYLLVVLPSSHSLSIRLQRLMGLIDGEYAFENS
jgi:hypothetical protein